MGESRFRENENEWLEAEIAVQRDGKQSASHVGTVMESSESNFP